MSGERGNVIIIGGGHNGLVASFYMARAGFKPIVLEARPMVGGMAVTEEVWPGFRCPTLAHTGGPIRAEIVRDMALERHGLRMTQPKARVTSVSPDGGSVTVYDDPAKTAQHLAAVSARDGKSFTEFQSILNRLGKIFAQLAGNTPPDIDSPSKDDLFRGVSTGRMIRKLGKQDLYRLLRWAPMPIADLMDECFDSDLLKGALAARAIFGSGVGPRSPGTSNLLLLRCADDLNVAGSASFPIGGTGALTQAMAQATTAAGTTIRTNAEVAGITIKDGRVTGVRLTTGEEIAASAVISNADPVRTLLNLVDPVHLTPTFLQHVQQYRSSGVVAKINLAVDGLPKFPALEKREDRDVLYPGRIHVGPSMNYVERAFDFSKYGEFSREPYMDVMVPTVSDPSLAPSGKHIMSVYVQFAPYALRTGDWKTRAGEFADCAIKTLSAYVPDLPNRILHQQVITPAEIESTYGSTGGHIFHGELTLEQFFTMRPLLGYARYRTPIKGLYMCGSGTHPGAGLTGRSGENAAREIVKDLR
ncbi:amine oxidase [Candidatus Koribacter versatilis Ellin345]|uniref:Pyridine nucleotide-disulfide oxidoreductase domain-containing protein 2 n=1 Tax=Koribacter versatilis (strain Ellin345) TaxID=204669 RepID=Q1IS77_KORVE|nr:NAD(P)/FAD-dependent oxidoreductase [Candidatus Koribacter versatilis]ABF40273.1 amine oxidase [Candidatus Koribacter versatilis Ellin345]